MKLISSRDGSCMHIDAISSAVSSPEMLSMHSVLTSCCLACSIPYLSCPNIFNTCLISAESEKKYREIAPSNFFSPVALVRSLGTSVLSIIMESCLILSHMAPVIAVIVTLLSCRVASALNNAHVLGMPYCQ